MSDNSLAPPFAANDIAAMKARGAHLINETPEPGAHGTKVAFIHPKGTHGVLIELVEHPTEEKAQ